MPSPSIDTALSHSHLPGSDFVPGRSRRIALKTTTPSITQRFGRNSAMRVYTNSTLRSLVGYGKLLAGLAVLLVLLYQGARILQDDPALQELRNLLQIEEAQ